MPDYFEISMLFSDLHSWIQYYSDRYITDSTIHKLSASLSRFKWFSKQPENVQCALINLILMNGMRVIKNVPDLLSSIDECNYKKASLILMNSKIYLKNTKRVKDICMVLIDK